ncbi:MAG: aminotransferase class I/II-fold pyridoxal phosphate-dependent enzyme [Nitrososphaeria archaeon]|nr:aminotransferase class I/II-fold pyridoxal phosphate-dependent enzyme [Nitrososphaeria archaeon]
MDLGVKPSSRWKNIPLQPTVWTRFRSIKEELERKGKRVIGLYDGDVVLFGHSNPPLSEILAQAAWEGWHMYPSSTTWQSQLRETIAEFERSYRGVKYKVEDVILTPGVSGCYRLLHNTLLDPGDELLALEPAHYLWGPSSYMYCFDSKIVTSGCDEANDWEPDLDELRAAMSEKTKGIILDHPNNPTGAIHSDNALKQIVSIAGEYDIPIISDEIYGLITYDGAEAKSMPTLAGDVPVIVLSSMSKRFMKPGWRVGYMCLHDPQGKMEEYSKILRKVALIYGHATSNIATPILVAATRAFRRSLAGLQSEFRDVGGVESTETDFEEREMLRNLQRRRDFTWRRLNEIEEVRCTKPKASLYAFPHVEAIDDSWKTTEEFILELLKEEGIMFAPGNLFGKSGVGHFRTLLTPNLEILEEAYNRLEGFLKRHTH